MAWILLEMVLLEMVLLEMAWNGTTVNRRVSFNGMSRWNNPSGNNLKYWLKPAGRKDQVAPSRVTTLRMVARVGDTAFQPHSGGSQCRRSVTVCQSLLLHSSRRLTRQLCPAWAERRSSAIRGHASRYPRCSLSSITCMLSVSTLVIISVYKPNT